MKKTKLLSAIIALCVSLALGFAVVACGGSETEGKTPVAPFTITVNANGGAFSDGKTSITVKTDENGKVVAAVETPTRDGYALNGYNTKKDGSGVEAIFGQDGSTFQRDHTVYAQWKAEEVKYTVTFETNGGIEQAQAEYIGSALELPTPFYYGYEFAGWFEKEDLSGTAVNCAAYTPTADVTLYAKWDKVTYIYFYYGEDRFEDKRLSFHEGDVVDLEETFTPEPLKVGDVHCPFVRWTDEWGAPHSSVTVGSDTIIMLAEYDMSGLPAKHNYTQNPDGSITATGKLAWTQTQAVTNIGVYSVEVAFGKGNSGGAGIAFRMELSGNDYPYEDKGTDYISAVIIPASGRLQVSSVTDGAFAQMTGSAVAFDAMPESWQEKFNAATGDIKTVLTLVDYGNKFEIYIDGERAYTFSDATYLAKYTGTGFGVRCSSTGADFAKFSHRGTLTVSFETNGGTAADSIEWLYGPIVLPVPDKDDGILEGWYYDSALNRKVDAENFVADGDIKLYAKYTDGVMVKFMSYGELVASRALKEGQAVGELPELSKANVTLENLNTVKYTFLGWYANEERVTAETVFTENTTVIAKFDEEVRRNGYLVTQDANGDVYNLNDYASGFANGFTIPGIEVKQGEYSFDLTLGQKAATEYSMRIMFFAQDENKVSFTGGDSKGTNMQGSVWVNFFTHSGQVTLGRKIGGTTGGISGGGAALAAIKDCAYKTKFNNWTSGPCTFRLKVVFDKNSVKFYIDDCLLIVYGDADYTGETLYGVALKQTNDPLFAEWINCLGASAANVACKKDVPMGYKVGVHAWHNPSLVGGQSKISNIVAKNYPHITYNDGEKDIAAETLTFGKSITKTLPDSEPMTDAAGAYLNRFIGWYTQADGGEKVETADAAIDYADARGDVTLYARCERVTLYTVAYDADNGETEFVQYYEYGAPLVLPDNDPFKNGVQSGDNYIGYTFDKWQLDNADIPDNYAVTENVTLVAKYTATNAYSVDFVTGVDGLTAESIIVAENTAATLPELDRVGWRLVGWYTDEDMQNAYNGEGVAGKLTLYAKWVEQITIKFVSEGKTVSTQVIDKGSTAELPAAQTKASYTAENKCVYAYTFDGWYIDKQQVTSTTAFDADAEVTAVFAEEITRNGVIMEYGDDGNITAAEFGPKWVVGDQGVMLPDIELTEGYFEYTLKIKKASSAVNVRIAFFMNEAGNIKFTGTGNQGSMWVNFNANSGGIIFGRKIKGNTNNTFVLAYAQIKACEYKTKFSAYKTGDDMEFKFRIEFGVGKYKFYIDDCLLGVYGDADYTGETLYGKELNESTVSAAAGLELFDSWMAAPEGFGIGMVLWENLAPVGGTVRMENIKYGSMQTVKADAGERDQTLPVQAARETVFIEDKEKESW